MNTQFYYAYKNARNNIYIEIDLPQCDNDYFEIEYKNGKAHFNILLFNLVCKFTLNDYKKVISMLSDDPAGQEKAEKLHDLYIEIAKVLTSDKEKYLYDKKVLADISDAFNRLNKLNEALMNCFTIDSLDLEKPIKMKKATAYKMIGKDQLIVDYNAKSFEKFGYTWIVSIDAKVRGRKHIIVPSCGLPCATYDGSFKEAIEILDKELFTRVMNAMKNYDPAAFFNLLKENDIKEIPAFKVDDPTESTPEALKRIENVTIEEFYNKYMWEYDLLFNAEKVNISLEYSKHERCFKLYLPELSIILGEFNTYRNDYRLDDRDTAAFIMAIEHFQKCNKKTIAGYPLPSFSDLQERIEKEEAWKNTIELENMQISAAV